MSKLPHILLVDDDLDITALLSAYLRRYHFEVTCAHEDHGMRQVLASSVVDLVVLDWMLPGTDGLTLAREVRTQSRIPVIMLTARSGRFDCVMSLENGADDYMSKPFEPRELVARIQAVLRRVREQPVEQTRPQDAHVVWFDGWRLHRMERHLTSPAGVVLPLSNAEFRLLTTFVNHPRKLLTREQLMDEARGRDADAFDRSIDLLVSRVRQKLAKGLAAPAEPGPDATLAEPVEELIKTVRGAGYIFNARQVQALPTWGG